MIVNSIFPSCAHVLIYETEIECFRSKHENKVIFSLQYLLLNPFLCVYAVDTVR